MAETLATIGKEIGGYILEMPIGFGAGSVIYRAREPRTGRRYAVKAVERDGKAEEKHLRQVLNEFEVARKFKHSHVVDILDLARRRTLLRLRACYLIMEYVPGAPLSRQENMGLGALLEVFRSIASALTYIHQQGFIHADVKPSNILIRDDGVAKLCDFGLVGEASVRRGRVQGTMDFAAPEQLMHKICDARTDVYAFGATMYRALAGHNLPSRAVVQRRVKFGTGYVKAPSFHNKNVPSALDKLVMDCCRMHRSKRPGSMTEVSGRLEAIAGALGKPERPENL